jgi:gas vesicle protein
LVYFTTKYRAASLKEENGQLDITEEISSDINRAAQDAARLFGRASNVSAREIAEIKDKLKDLSYYIEEIKLLEEKRNTETAKTIARIEQRVSTFENEYVSKLQPTLYSLINELENIQTKTKN